MWSCLHNSSICCWSRRAGTISDGVSPPPPRRTCAQIPARASNHSWLSRLICGSSIADGAQVQVAFRCGPISVSRVLALSSTVCPNGIGTAEDAAAIERPS